MARQGNTRTIDKDDLFEMEEGRTLDLVAATGTSVPAAQLQLLNQMLASLSMHPNLSDKKVNERYKAAVAMLEALAPRDQAEGMLSAQMVATHHAAMDCLGRAMHPEQTFAGRELNLKHASKLLNIYTRQLEVLDKRRGKGQQKVTVEYVNVESGGQAVVGNVTTSPRRRRGKAPPESKTLEHVPDVPLAVAEEDEAAHEPAARKQRRRNG